MKRIRLHFFVLVVIKTSLGKSVPVVFGTVAHDNSIILCTGFSERITAKKAKAIGMQAFVMRPTIVHQMAEIVRGLTVSFLS